MKKLGLLLLIVMGACCSPVEPPSLQGATEYTPLNIDAIQNGIAQKFNITFGPIDYYTAKNEDLHNTCLPFGGSEKFVSGCNFSDYSKIFIDERIKDHCRILTHELIHQALFLKNGDADSEHRNEAFTDQNIISFCESLHIDPSLTYLERE